MTEVYRLFTDGGARGNPGPAGFAGVLKGSDGRLVDSASGSLDWSTNNVAEYEGLIAGLTMARANGVRRLRVFMDSTLVVQQMRGVWKVKHAGLVELHRKARAAAAEFEEVVFEVIGREANSEADRLANLAMDEAAARR